MEDLPSFFSQEISSDACNFSFGVGFQEFLGVFPSGLRNGGEDDALAAMAAADSEEV